MSKFIETDKLLAEIKELLKTAENNERDAFMKVDAEGHIIAVTKTAMCLKIMNIITSLQREKQEVDLDAEIAIYLNKNVLTRINNSEIIEDFTAMEAGDLARHFYELGRNGKEVEL